MANTTKQIGIKQLDGTFINKNIGVDAANVDGLSTLLAGKADAATTYTKSEIDEMIAGAGQSTIYSKTLTAGQTSVVFDGISIDKNYIANFYSSTGVDYVSIDMSVPGQITVTYDPQSSNIVIYLRLEEIKTS